MDVRDDHAFLAEVDQAMLGHPEPPGNVREAECLLVSHDRQSLSSRAASVIEALKHVPAIR
jgi:hypothetical protein